MALKWRRLLRLGRTDALDYTSSPEELTEGNRLSLLHDGRETFPAMLEAIASARLAVHLETYILRDDATGKDFARALGERARAGVQVRVIYDSVGSLGLSDSYLQGLRNSGVQLLAYRPIAPWRRRWGWGRRDHRKILVIDGKVAFTGGINIAHEHASAEAGGGGWRDIQVRVEGPAAYDLDALFRSVWFRETRRWFELPGHPRERAGGALVQVVANQEFLHRHRIRQEYRHAIHRARRRILIANAYFVPDRAIRKALYAARRRGVIVDVLVPSRSDVPAVQYASRSLFETHLQNGLRLFAWPGPHLHTKLVVIDGAWCSVGSYNLDHRSWLHNLEVNLHVEDAAFAREAERAVLQDIALSSEVKLERWRERAWDERLLENFFSLLRYWL
ncbi:MAG TPA: phospholipase D-like domain-containing protein [Elusimicrobiota bacterium]|jgi:cardiolipin synthase|nr:phospholipase D-like domain-containing protein [Elusimicrobiota bacterium]